MKWFYRSYNFLAVKWNLQILHRYDKWDGSSNFKSNGQVRVRTHWQVPIYSYEDLHLWTCYCRLRLAGVISVAVLWNTEKKEENLSSTYFFITIYVYIMTVIYIAIFPISLYMIYNNKGYNSNPDLPLILLE